MDGYDCSFMSVLFIECFLLTFMYGTNEFQKNCASLLQIHIFMLKMFIKMLQIKVTLFPPYVHLFKI